MTDNIKSALRIFFGVQGKWWGGFILLVLAYNLTYTVYYTATGSFLWGAVFLIFLVWLGFSTYASTRVLHRMDVARVARRKEAEERLAEIQRRHDEFMAEHHAYMEAHRARMREIRGE